MKKRILAMLLAMVMLFGALPISAFATEATDPIRTLCEMEGCTYAYGHEGDCSPVVDQAAAQNVIDLIDDIGEVTLESEATISAADTAYNALTDTQKALVTNLDVLEAAKTAYGALSTPAPIAADPVTISVTISNMGELVVRRQPVFVTDYNGDGDLDVDDALYAAHEAFYPHGGAAGGYACAQWGDSLGLSMLWSNLSGAFGYHVNDIPCWDLTVPVTAGDYLVAYIYQDQSGWSDAYARFTEGGSYTTTAGTPLTVGIEKGEWNEDYSNFSFSAFDGASVSCNTAGVCTVSGNSVTFTSPGTYYLVATSEYPLLVPAVAIVTVTGSSTEVEKVELNKTETVIAVGHKETLTATVKPDNASDKTVTWSSSDETVATVDAGEVTALKAGTAEITAKTANGASATCTVTVTRQAAKLAVLKFASSSSSTATAYTMTPAFDPAVTEYTVVVPDSTSSVYAWATMGEESSGVINASYTNTGGAAKTVALTSGKASGTSLSQAVASGKLNGNTIAITIDDLTAYTVKIVRQATLSKLTVSVGESAVQLTPSFNAAKYEYNADVAYDAVLTVTPTAKSTGASITINGGTATSVTPVWTDRTCDLVVKVSGGEGTVDSTYTVHLAQLATKIEILTPPAKTTYNAGESFDPTGMTLKATYSDGFTETIEKDAYSYTPTGAMGQSVKEIEVSFDGLSVKQSITVPAAFKGAGTEAYPYLIETTEDLVQLSKLVAGGVSFSGEYFKMVNPITLPDAEGDDAWVPLGVDKTKPFSGNFDGGNHLLTVPEGGLPLIGTPKGATLSNLNVYGSKIAGYGVVNNYCEIGKTHAITIENVTLKSGTQTLQSGFIGGYASGSDTVTIRNCTVEQGVVIGYDKSQKWVGSFAGEFNGTIETCVSYATVYGTDFVGGIVSNKGQSMGAFTISNCQFYGDVIATGNYVGGIVGHGYGGTGWGFANNAGIPTITNCTSTGSVTGANYVGGIYGGDVGVVQVRNNGVGSVAGNSFTGTVSATGGEYVGAIIGYLKSLNKNNVIENNTYSASCGAAKGIGYVQYVDTSCETHETASGATYVNSANSKPAITGFMDKNLNRTDDPLGADAEKLCRTAAQQNPIAVELKATGAYKDTYYTGEALDLSGIVLTVVYNDDSSKTVALEDATVSGYDKNKVGQQSVALSYNGLTATITVTVQNRETELSVTVTVLGDQIHDSDSDGNVHTLAAGNLTTWINAKSVKVDSNATALDAIKKALDDSGLTCTYSWNSAYNSYYIESVNGLEEFANGQRSGWLWSVNGTQPSVGVSAYYLKNGDKITLHYTDDYAAGSNENTEAVEKIQELIAAIGTVTLNKADKITAARKAYDALTDAQKQEVDNYAKLTAAEAKYAELKQADDEKKASAGEDLIDAIKEGSTTFEDDVKAAQKAYNNLTADQKKLVDNYYKLAGYLKELADEEDKEAAEAVEKLIAAIGTVTSDSEEKIKAARDAYEKLTDEQKALVENLTTLEAAEKKLAALKGLENVQNIYKTTGDYLEELGTPGVGSVGGEWMVIGLSRSGREIEAVDAYYEAAIQYVQENVDDSERLHSAKSTENARMILALTAIGKDVTDVGGHDLLNGLNSMEYIQKQGINGPIWALSAFDSGNYPVPDGDVSREALIQVILDAQLADGGWALSDTVSDPDITGMVLQALAPYYQTNVDVKSAIDDAVETLSDMQAADGSFDSIDGKSSESIAQVITGLTALGINPHTDERFVKNGVSAIDALCTFYVEGGGFKHLMDGNRDGMATEQGYYALTAFFRMLDGKTSLCNMTDVIDLGGDVVAQVESTETVPAETEAVEVEDEGSGFPWFIIVIVLICGVAIAVPVIKKKLVK